MSKFIDLLATNNISISGTYKNAKTKVGVKCNVCNNTWEVIPSNVVSRGNGLKCSHCYNTVNTNKTHDQFEAEFSAKYPSFKLLSTYEGAKIPVTITCANGHVRSVQPTNLLSRDYSKCKECGDFVQSNKDKVASKIKSKFPYLELIEYEGSNNELLLLNTKCGHTGLYWYSNIITKGAYSCKVCNPVGSSSEERNLVEILRNRYSLELDLNNRDILDGEEIDIVVHSYRVGIEYNGSYYHSEQKGKSNKYHQNKVLAAKEAGYRLIHIYDTDNLSKVIDRLDSIFGKNLIIAARKCYIMEIPMPDVFLENNHLQGAGRNTSVNLGLFLKGELVQVMTFSKPIFGNASKYQYELVRLASLAGITIVGGASKLFKYFVRKYNPDSIMSWAKLDWSFGEVYQKLGFTQVEISTPDYVYVKNKVVVPREQCTKAKLLEKYPDLVGTEKEIMQSLGYVALYKSGSIKYVWNKVI
jgi:very-short-patch-repair endonuclease